MWNWTMTIFLTVHCVIIWLFLRMISICVNGIRFGRICLKIEEQYGLEMDEDQSNRILYESNLDLSKCYLFTSDAKYERAILSAMKELGYLNSTEGS